MYENGIRHRDIKPQNVLVKDDIVKLVDFGLSRFSERDSITLTATSLIAGTQGYLPPEYSDGAFKEGTIEGDVYMIGKTLYYLFSGGEDVSNIRRNNVSAPIADIIDKATQNAPNDRYPSVSTIIEELRVYKESLDALDNLPKSIKEIKAQYSPKSKEYKDEIFKHLMALSDESMRWGKSLGALTRAEIKDMLTYKRNHLNSFATYFMECLVSPSDYIQFEDIDEFAKLTRCIVEINTDIAVNQQLLAFIINLTENYNRWPSMNILAGILNKAIRKYPKQYRLFIYNHKNELKDMIPNLTDNNRFNNEISQILSGK